uniref:Candidate secreted effector n=1 Tax=Meloidogyne incognita TaxID=6306 RepID=A0A914M9I6_MELIC
MPEEAEEELEAEDDDVFSFNNPLVNTGIFFCFSLCILFNDEPNVVLAVDVDCCEFWGFGRFKTNKAI